MDYYKFVHDNLQAELDNVDYYNGLRRRRNQHSTHQPKFDSNCSSCRAAYWMEKLQEFDRNESTDETKPVPRSIGMVNIVKTESTSSNGNATVKAENLN